MFMIVKSYLQFHHSKQKKKAVRLLGSREYRHINEESFLISFCCSLMLFVTLSGRSLLNTLRFTERKQKEHLLKQ